MDEARSAAADHASWRALQLADELAAGVTCAAQVSAVPAGSPQSAAKILTLYRCVCAHRNAARARYPPQTRLQALRRKLALWCSSSQPSAAPPPQEGFLLRWMDLPTPFALSTPTPNLSPVVNGQDRLYKLLRRKPLHK